MLKVTIYNYIKDQSVLKFCGDRILLRAFEDIAFSLLYDLYINIDLYNTHFEDSFC